MPWYLIVIAGMILFMMGYALCALMASGKISDMQSEMIMDVNKIKESEDKLKRELAGALAEKKKLRLQLNYVNEQFMHYRTKVQNLNNRIERELNNTELDTDNLNYMEAGL